MCHPSRVVEADFRFAIMDGKIKIKVEAEGHVVQAEIDESAVTSAFLFASRQWSQAIRGAVEIRRTARML